MRRTLGFVLTVLLVGAVAATVVKAVHSFTDPQVVRGVVTPAQRGLFADPSVRARLEHAGLDVKVDVVPDAQLAAAARNSKYAFAIAPSGYSAASVAQARRARSTSVVASTPLTVTTSAAVAQQLERQGAVADDGTGHPSLDVAKLPAGGDDGIVMAGGWSSDSGVLATYLVADAVAPNAQLQTVPDVDGVVNKVIPMFSATGALTIGTTSAPAPAVTLALNPDVSADATLIVFNGAGARVAKASPSVAPAQRTLPPADVLAALATRVGAAARVVNAPVSAPVVSS